MLIHIDWAGKPDSYGSKVALLVLAAIGVGLYGLLRYLGNRRFELPRRTGGPKTTTPRVFRIGTAACLLCLLVVVLALVLSS